MRINDSSVLRILREALGMQDSEAGNLTIKTEVQPVCEVNPKLQHKIDYMQQFSSSTTGTLSIVVATPTDRDIYVVGASISIIKDAACDLATGSCNLGAVDENGKAISLSRISVLTATAQNSQQTAYFGPVGIKLQRGSAITMAGTFTAGAYVRSGVIYAYMTDRVNSG